MVVRPHAKREADLLQIAHASDALRLGFGLGKRGQEETCKDGDDGDHDEQLDERERLLSDGAIMIHSLMFLIRSGTAVFLRYVDSECQLSFKLKQHKCHGHEVTNTHDVCTF